MATRIDAHRLRAALLGSTAALTVAGWTTAASWPVSSQVWWQQIPPRVVGAAIIIAGVVLWVRGPSPRIGALIVLGGAVYHLQDLRALDEPLFAIGFCLAYEWMAIAGHVLLSWPDGHLNSAMDRAYVVAAHIICVGTQTARYLADRPRPPWAIHIPQETTFWGALGSASGVVMGVVAIIIVARRWAVASLAKRIPSGLVWVGVGAVASIKIAEAVMTVVPSPPDVKITLASLFTAAVLVLVPVLYGVHRLHLRLARSRVVTLVVDLERARDAGIDPSNVQHALRQTLGDPTLRLAYPLEDGTVVDVDGNPTDSAPPAPGRARTLVRARGAIVATIEHDAVLSAQQAVTDAAIAAAGFALENARLYATVLAQVQQLRMSRLLLAQTALDERQRIQRDLHDSAQQRLFAVLLLLDTARSGHSARAVDAAHHELTDALRALRDLIHGIYPAVLLDHGLAAAVENLIDRAPIPVDIDIAGTRWTKHVEVTAYFVISEALTNVYRHSGATEAHIQASAYDQGLVVAITDNGRGGASPEAGNGLRGLRYRVDAVGGTLTIHTSLGRGTTIEARFPDEPDGAGA